MATELRLGCNVRRVYRTEARSVTADSDFGLPKAIAIIEIEEITQPTIDPLTLYCENDV